MPKKEDIKTEKRLLDTLDHLKKSGLSSEEIIKLGNKLLKVEIK